VIAQLVQPVGYSAWGQQEDLQVLAKAIKDLRKQPELLDRNGSNGRRFLPAYYRRLTLTGRYHELVKKIKRKT
jgi:glycosyltransferase involved in cell wall biosynthesis